MAWQILILTAAMVAAVGAEIAGKKYCLVPCSRFIGIPVPVLTPVPAFRWDRSWMNHYPAPPYGVTFRRRRRRDVDHEFEPEQFCKVSLSMCRDSMSAQNDAPQNQPNGAPWNQIWQIVNSMAPGVGQLPVPSPVTNMLSNTGPTLFQVVQVPVSWSQAIGGGSSKSEVPPMTTHIPEISTVYSQPIVIKSNPNQERKTVKLQEQQEPLVVTTLKPDIEAELNSASYCLIKGTANTKETVTCNVISYFPLKDCHTDSGMVAVCTADGTEKDKSQKLNCQVVEDEQFICTEMSS